MLFAKFPLEVIGGGKLLRFPYFLLDLLRASYRLLRRLYGNCGARLKV